MKIISLDPRVNRMGLDTNHPEVNLPHSEGFITWEVFHQKKKGAQHTHVGIVHAPNEELALVAAKETFGRRGATTSLWVIKSSNIIATDVADEDMFESTPEKLHREASMYATRDKIEKYKFENNIQ